MHGHLKVAWKNACRDKNMVREAAKGPNGQLHGHLFLLR